MKREVLLPRRLCYDGMKVCPFFAWSTTRAKAGSRAQDQLPDAQCGAPENGYLLWYPKHPIRVESPPECPLASGPVTVRFEET